MNYVIEKFDQIITCLSATDNTKCLMKPDDIHNAIKKLPGREGENTTAHNGGSI